MRVLSVNSSEQRTECAPRGEEGSLMAVMAVLFVVILLSVALINRVQGDLQNTNHETNLQHARSLAQSGIADALFQIDQQGSTPRSFCNEPNNGGACAFSSIPGAPNTSYTARYVSSSNSYTVLSRATVRGSTYAVQVSVSRGSYIDDAIYGGAFITFNGNSTTDLSTTGPYGAYRTVTDGVSSVGSTSISSATANFSVADVGDIITGTDIPAGTTITAVTDSTDATMSNAASGTGTNLPWKLAPPPGPVAIAVGPGGTLTCHGPSDPDAIYISYGGVISGCQPTESLGPVYSPQDPTQTCPAPLNPYGAPPTPCLPSSAQPCTAVAGTVTGNDSTGYTIKGPATLEPGIYVCRGGLTMTGTISVDGSSAVNGGRVEIFNFPAVGSSTPPNISLSGAVVNQCANPAPAGGAQGPANNGCAGKELGDPTDLQIYGWGAGTAALGGTCPATGDSDIDAIFWAPSMHLKMNGNSDSLCWTGSMIIGSITANGSPSVNLFLDQRLQDNFQTSNWQIAKYWQTSPSFSIP